MLRKIKGRYLCIFGFEMDDHFNAKFRKLFNQHQYDTKYKAVLIYDCKIRQNIRFDMSQEEYSPTK